MARQWSCRHQGQAPTCTLAWLLDMAPASSTMAHFEHGDGERHAQPHRHLGHHDTAVVGVAAGGPVADEAAQLWGGRAAVRRHEGASCSGLIYLQTRPRTGLRGQGNPACWRRHQPCPPHLGPKGGASQEERRHQGGLEVWTGHRTGHQEPLKADGMGASRGGAAKAGQLAMKVWERGAALLWRSTQL